MQSTELLMTPARAAAIQMDMQLPYPDAAQASHLRDEHGCETWGAYIVAMADERGVPYSRALALFSVLGPSEAFDAFVTYLDDMDGQLQ